VGFEIADILIAQLATPASILDPAADPTAFALALWRAAVDRDARVLLAIGVTCVVMGARWLLAHPAKARELAERYPRATYLLVRWAPMLISVGAGLSSALYLGKPIDVAFWRSALNGLAAGGAWAVLFEPVRDLVMGRRNFAAASAAPGTPPAQAPGAAASQSEGQ